MLNENTNSMSAKKNIVFKDINIITPYEYVNKKCVVVEGNLIKGIYNNPDEISMCIDADNMEIFEFKNKYLVPGFIDIHAHGANGVDCYSKTLEPWSLYNAENGVTSYLPTLLTMPLKDMYASVKNIIGQIEEGLEKPAVKSRVLGINMEGPYLNPKYGAQNPEFNINIKKEDYEEIIKITKGYLKIMTIAPELEGSVDLIRRLVEEGIIVSLGHSEANYDQTCIALENGATLATHIFCVMGNNLEKDKGVEPTEIGEVLLIDDKVYAELMSDKEGVHVHKVFQKILFKCKGIEKIILITDTMSNAGYKPGKYVLPDGRSYKIEEGKDVLRLDSGKLLGGFFKLRDAVNNFKNATEISLIDAIKTVTINPARLLGIDDKLGSIEPGKYADINIVDENLNVYLTMVGGNIVFKNSSVH